MRAAGAKCRRSGDRLYTYVNGFRFNAEQLFFQELRIELIHIAYEVFAHTVYSGSFDLCFHKTVKFFNNIKLFDLCREIAYQLHGQRVGKAYLEEGCIAYGEDV